MPKVRTKSLRILAAKIPPSIFSGAIEESADYIDELEAENNQLREALQFYADSQNYEANVTDQWEPVILVDKDQGAIARDALEVVK